MKFLPSAQPVVQVWFIPVNVTLSVIACYHRRKYVLQNNFLLTVWLIVAGKQATDITHGGVPFSFASEPNNQGF